MSDLPRRKQADADQCPSALRWKTARTKLELSFNATPSSRCVVLGAKLLWLFSTLIIMLSAFPLVIDAQDCTNKTTTFLLLTNAKLEEPNPSDSVLTFNLTSCIQGCHDEPRCMAVNIESNPENAFCQYFHYTKSSRSEDAVPNEWPVQPMSIYYLQKTCLKGACGRAFSFELASGYDLIGHELILVKNSTEGHCMETCLASRQTFGIRCLSFTYSLGTQECRINSESRFTRPGDFVKTNNSLTRYYDNNCEDELARQLDLDLVQAAALAGPNITREDLLVHLPPPSFELMRKDTAMRFTDSDYPGVNLKECETLCTTNNEFICRSFVFGRTRLGMFCGLSHHTMASLRYVPNSVFPMYGVSIYQRSLPAFNDASGQAVPLASESINAAISAISAADALIQPSTVLPLLQDVAANLPSPAPPVNITALKNFRRNPMATTSTTSSPTIPRRQLQTTTATSAAFGAGGSASNATSASLDNIEFADAMLTALMDSAGLNNSILNTNRVVKPVTNNRNSLTSAAASTGGLINSAATSPASASACWPNMILQSGKTVNIKPYRTLPQYTASECIAECERDQTCTAMQIDYSNAECAFFNFTSVGSESAIANASMRDSGMANYYEKVCFDRRNQARCGGKDWAFELLRGKTLETLDLQSGIFNVIETPNRDKCLEECMTSKGRVCKTVEYNMRTRMCRLSKLDRYSRTLNSIGLRRRSILRSRESRQLQLVNSPTSTTSPAGNTAAAVQPAEMLLSDDKFTMVYESNCFSEPRQFCTFDKIEGFDISLVDKTVMEGVKTEEDCRQLCLQETAFNCRTYSLISQFACMLSHHIMENAPPSAVVAGPKDAISHFQVKNCYNVTVECTPDAMRAVVETNRIFGGLLYARGRSATCTKHIQGTYSFSLDLPLPNQPNAQMCGTVVQRQQKDENATWYSNTVILQHNDHVVTSSDHAINVKCRYEQTKKTRLVHEGPLVRNTSQAISDTIVREDIFRWGEAQLPVPRMEVLDRMGKEMLEADLGDQMIVRISFAEPTTIYSVQATDLVARDGVGLNNMTLIDGDGCIVEGAIVKEVRKPRNDVFEIVLEVFAFPEDDTLVLEVIAETCHGLCPTAGTCLPDQTHRLTNTRQGRYFPARPLPVKRAKRAVDLAHNEAAIARLRYALTAPVFRQARVVNNVGSGFVQYLAHENGNEHAVAKSALLPASLPSATTPKKSPSSIRVRRSPRDSPFERSDDDENFSNGNQDATSDGSGVTKKNQSSDTKLHEQQTSYHQKIIKVRNSRFDLPSDGNTVAAQQVIQPAQAGGCVSSKAFGAVLVGCSLILLTAFGICMVLCLRYNTIRRALIKVGGAPSTIYSPSRSLASSSLNSPSMTSSAAPLSSGINTKSNENNFAASTNSISSFLKLGTLPDAKLANNPMVALALHTQLLQPQLNPSESDCYLTPEQARCFAHSHC